MKMNIFETLQQKQTAENERLRAEYYLFLDGLKDDETSADDAATLSNYIDRLSLTVEKAKDDLRMVRRLRYWEKLRAELATRVVDYETLDADWKDYIAETVRIMDERKERTTEKYRAKDFCKGEMDKANEARRCLMPMNLERSDVAAVLNIRPSLKRSDEVTAEKEGLTPILANQYMGKASTK